MHPVSPLPVFHSTCYFIVQEHLYLYSYAQMRPFSPTLPQTLLSTIHLCPCSVIANSFTSSPNLYLVSPTRTPLLSTIHSCRTVPQLLIALVLRPICTPFAQLVPPVIHNTLVPYSTAATSFTPSPIVPR